MARGAAGAKLDMNHVWVHVWPVVDVDVERLTALGTKISPLTDGAGVEEVVAQGRVAGPGGDPLADGRALQRPAGSRRGLQVEEPPTSCSSPLDDYASQGRPLPSSRTRLPLRARAAC